MKGKSIRARLQVVIIIIASLTAVIFLNYYLSEVLSAAHSRYHKILTLEIRFHETLQQEKASLPDSVNHAALAEKYAKLDSLVATTVGDHLGLLMTRRKQILKQLPRMQSESRTLYAKVDDVLPDLLESVRYIHEHHIAYMKNLLARGQYEQDYDPAVSFERSQIHSAPEIDIIAAAISIQTTLSDIFRGFYDMQRGVQPSSVRAEFEARIKRFFKAVNTFEDYSLDAQDGILVEELLLNGRRFEEWFKGLLALEQTKSGILAELDDNRNKFLLGLAGARRRIEVTNQKVTTDIRLLQVGSLIAALILCLYILLQGRHINKEFKRTVQETERIQADLSYRVQSGNKDFREFRIIFAALNAMAGTIAGQIQKLEEARIDLNRRVQERTAELSSANARLQKEIEDRIRSDQVRSQLETRLRRAERMEAMGTLAGGVAHDLNNILTGIVGYPELILLDLPEGHFLREPLRTIQASGEKAAAIVQNLLTLSRREVISFKALNLNDIVQEYLKSPEFKKMQSFHPRADIQVNLQADLGNILGSRIHLLKTVMNLLSNALESMPEGGTVKVATENRYVDMPIGGYDNVEEGDYVSLKVSDEGSGITQEDMERIFEPFFTKKQMGRSGTGLGLAVVWGTVKDHNGYIDVHSRKDRGTTFTLFFPLNRSSLEAQDEAAPIESYAGHGETVLVVDDVAEQRLIATKMLEKLGYKTHAVPSGESAVDYLRTCTVDLLVLDMIMVPGMDGLETYQKILELHPGQKAIIASGFSETAQVQQAQQLGAGAYVKKPYTLDKIGLAVHDALKRS